MNFRIIQAIIKCFERSTVERIEENSNDVSSGVQLYVHKFRPWRNEEQKVENRKKRHYTRMAVLHSLISPWKRKGKKRKKSYYNTGYSYLVTHPSTIPAQQDLTLLSRRNMLLTLWNLVGSCGIVNHWIIRKFTQLVNFVTFSVFYFFFGNRVWLNLYERAFSGNETSIITGGFYFYYEDVRVRIYSM